MFQAVKNDYTDFLAKRVQKVNIFTVNPEHKQTPTQLTGNVQITPSTTPQPYIFTQKKSAKYLA